MLAAVLEDTPRARRRLLVAVAFVAAVFRLLYVAEIHDHPFWRTPLVDAADYHARAMQVMRGEGLGAAVYYKAPAYVFLVGQLYRLVGPRLEVVYALQMAGGVLWAVLAAALAWSWYGPLAALVAGVLGGLYASLPYYENQLLVETAALAAGVTAVFLLWNAPARASRPGMAGPSGGRAAWRRIAADVAAGLAAGLALQLRPLDAALVIGLGLLLLLGGEPAALRVRRALCFLAPVLLLLVPTLRHNRLASGHLIPVSVNGGINFYIGNNPDYDATVAIRPGLRWEELTERFDAMDDPVRWQQNFYAASFAWMRAHPAAAAGLFVKKLVLFWNRIEIDRNQDSRALRADSQVRRWLGVPWSVLAVFGLLGLGLQRRDWRRRPVHGLVLVQMLAVVGFFVTGRYRLAVVPYLAIGAGSAIAALRDRTVTGGRRALRREALAIALLVLLVVPGWYGAGRIDFGRPEFEMAEVLARHGDRAGALQAYARAVVRHPDDPDVQFRYGEQLERSGQEAAALDAYRRAAALAPWSYKPPLALGAALLERGDLDGAWTAFVEAEKRGDPHGRTLYDMGLVRERQGDPTAALDLYRRSLQRPDTALEIERRHAGVGRALLALGRREEAAAEFRAARQAPGSDLPTTSDAAPPPPRSGERPTPARVPPGTGDAASPPDDFQAEHP